MKCSVFKFFKYKLYLAERLGGFRQRRGLRLAVSQALRCQPTFVSQVLNGEAHFSLEQAEKISRFLGHSPDEREYFFLLIQQERAGTDELKRYYTDKTKDLLAKRQVLVHRLGKDSALAREEQALYYSSWHFAAMHVALTVPRLRTREALAEFLRISPTRVAEVLDQLTTMGMVEDRSGELRATNTKVRLGNESPNILRHHANWRHCAVDSLERQNRDDFHYSGVLSLSAEARGRIRDIILDSLEKQLQISDASVEEELVGYCIDFFALQR